MPSSNVRRCSAIRVAAGASNRASSWQSCSTNSSPRRPSSVSANPDCPSKRKRHPRHAPPCARSLASRSKFSKTTSDSNNGWLLGTSLHSRIIASGVCSTSRRSTCCRRISRSQSCNRRSPATETRMGSVLMNSPTVFAASGTVPCRQARVVPNTTSSSPEWRPSSNAQAPCTSVLTVTPTCAAKATSAAVDGTGMRVSTVAKRTPEPRPLPDGSSAARSTASRVGAVKPRSAGRQYASAEAGSRRPSHSRKSAWDPAAGRSGPTPSRWAPRMENNSPSRMGMERPSNIRW